MRTVQDGKDLRRRKWEPFLNANEITQLYLPCFSFFNLVAHLENMHELNVIFLRSFRPDFLLVRQNLRDAGEDHRNLLLGFQYGGIPSVNSLESIYNFQVGWRKKTRTLRVLYQISNCHFLGQTLGVCPNGEGEEQAWQGGVPPHRADVLPQPERDGEWLQHIATHLT